MNPTEQQIAVIECDSPQIAVIAGPGSGKTATLVERIKHRGIPAKEIVCITFTNTGANEMRKRLLPIQPRFVGTIHRFMFGLLQKHGHMIGYRRGGIGLVDEETRTRMLLAIRNEMGHKKLSEKKLMEKDGLDAQQIWAEYGFRIKRENMIDYDTILVHGLRLLSNEIVRDEWAITDLYVDEVQDSGDIDWQIIRQFPAQNTFLVGDPDQSIFSFRGGRPALFVAHADNPGTTILTLEDCFRCNLEIADAANKLISRNIQRIEKWIRPVSNLSGIVSVNFKQNPHAEHRWLINAISDDLATGTTPSEIAVLARMNWLVNDARDVLRDAGIPIHEPPRIPNLKEWSAALALVGLLVDPESTILTEKYLLLTKHEHEVNAMKGRALAAKSTLPEVAKIVPPNFSITPENVPQFLSMKGIGTETIETVQGRLTESQPATVADLLHDLWNRDQWEEHRGGGVTVATAHGSKGREYDAVFVIGMEEGIFPLLRKDTDIEEERRLAFVAFTRARMSLRISASMFRKPVFGSPKPFVPSRFIAEAGL